MGVSRYVDLIGNYMVMPVILIVLLTAPASLATLFVLRRAHYPLSATFFGAFTLWTLLVSPSGLPMLERSIIFLTSLGTGVAGLFIESQEHRRHRGVESAIVEEGPSNAPERNRWTQFAWKAKRVAQRPSWRQLVSHALAMCSS